MERIFALIFGAPSQPPIDLARVRDWLASVPINWNRSVVGGSFARFWLTRDAMLRPRDVDVFVACQTLEDFEQEAARLGATFPCKDADESEAKYPEHLGVLGVGVIQNSPIAGMPIQLIGLKMQHPDVDAGDVLAAKTDVVGGTWVRLRQGKWQFTVMEATAGGGCVLPKELPLMACATHPRFTKYQDKGFSFFQEV